MMQQQRAATKAPVVKSRLLPRLFRVLWDNSKTKTRDPRKHHKQEAYGTVYPNGLVTLDNGQVFTMMSEMHHLLDLKGRYEIIYEDETARESGDEH